MKNVLPQYHITVFLNSALKAGEVIVLAPAGSQGLHIIYDGSHELRIRVHLQNSAPQAKKTFGPLLADWYQLLVRKFVPSP